MEIEIQYLFFTAQQVRNEVHCDHILGGQIGLKLQSYEPVDLGLGFEAASKNLSRNLLVLLHLDLHICCAN